MNYVVYSLNNIITGTFWIQLDYICLQYYSIVEGHTDTVLSYEHTNCVSRQKWCKQKIQESAASTSKIIQQKFPDKVVLRSKYRCRINDGKLFISSLVLRLIMLMIDPKGVK